MKWATSGHFLTSLLCRSLYSTVGSHIPSFLLHPPLFFIYLFLSPLLSSRSDRAHERSFPSNQLAVNEAEAPRPSSQQSSQQSPGGQKFGAPLLPPIYPHPLQPPHWLQLPHSQPAQHYNHSSCAEGNGLTPTWSPANLFTNRTYLLSCSAGKTSCDMEMLQRALPETLTDQNCSIYYNSNTK